jgi:hypothetical protein
VQHLSKGLGRGAEVKALAGRVVVGADGLTEATCRKGREIGFAWDEAPHPTDGVLDAALLPGRMGITEVSLHREAVQGQMAGELGAVVEGHGLAQAFR